MLSLNSIGWVSWIHIHIDITSLFVADLWLIFYCHVLPSELFSMVRRHGWQLPAHTFQVVAITVISLLIVAFYVFFAPFLGSPILECAAMAVYSPVALAVLLLYFRSTAIDPSDPGVLEKENKQRFLCNLDKPHAIPGVLVNVNTNQVTHIKSPLGLLTPARSSSVAHSDKEFDNNASWAEEGRQSMGLFDAELNRNLGALGFGGVLCGWLVQDDNCRDDSLRHQPPVADEEALFCTLCDVEVRKLSKHCRNCDKCVEGFDHHCRWLNNCVGRKNYVTFVFLMATSLLLLVLNWGTGIAVLARCFMDKRSVDRQILERLGNGFSRTGFTIVVALCTLVSLLASIPLGELFFFHILLMKKGITTYEYVMAMRAQCEPQGLADGEEQSMPTSPTSSAATGLSGSSSLGLHHRGAWCTPPRVFVEHQDEVIPHLAPGRVPSTVDPDATSPMKDSRFQKSAVKISAWKLAKLDPNEAARAAAKARQSSSVLRPLKMHDSSMVDTDYTSTMSSRSSLSTEFGLAGVGSAGTRKGGDTVGYSPQRPAFPFGQAGSKGEMDTRTQSSCSSPSRVSVNECGTSPLSSEGRLTLHVPPRFTALGQPVAQAPSIPGPPAAGFANALSNYRATSLDTINHLRRMNVAPTYEEYVGQSRASQLNRNLRESKRTAVFWSGGAERFKSTIANSNFNNTLEGKMPSLGSTQALAENSPQARFVPENASAVNGSFANNESGGGEGLPGNLLFNGASIFFGGPLCTPASLQRDYSTVSSALASAALTDNQVALSRVRNQDSRLFQGSTLRTQSPVFTPSSLQIETVFLK